MTGELIQKATIQLDKGMGLINLIYVYITYAKNV
jgi:hypothetical protein